MLTYQETPIQEVIDDRLAAAGVRLLIKREDLNHPFVSGNKWWKLKYNLEAAIRSDYKTLLTYGGAYSNHIYATAAAAAELRIHSIGMIRGEPAEQLNSTLSFAKEQGMELHFISRTAYRAKNESAEYLKQFKDYYYIPEGGTNALAVMGVKDFASKLDNENREYDYLCCPVGTGGTLSGLIEGVNAEKKILGFAVLKQSEFLYAEVQQLSEKSRSHNNWQIIPDYHFGGYAKSTQNLYQFIRDFKLQHDIPLEFVYTGKMIAGLYDMIQRGFFKRGSIIMAIHTGGLQATF
jgi:1-aminocyclopropane-1-carboxylate deaminase